jgi:hypothetical protein
MRFHKQPRWWYHGGGTNVNTGPAKPEPVYNRNINENPLSLALLGEKAGYLACSRFCDAPGHYNGDL